MLLHTSSDLRLLASRLVGIVSEPGLRPLEREVILIQSAGMQRFLSRELATRLGVAANLEFPFPRAFLQRTLGQLLGGEAEAERYERETLRWEIYRLLADVPEGKTYDLVRRYLSPHPSTLVRLTLAEQLAYLYDQYLTYRPRLILGWEGGEAADELQAELWRRLRERLGPHHLAARVARLLNEVSDDQIRAALPARISLVGGPGLPPLYLQVLARLGRATAVHVLSLLPTDEYIEGADEGDGALPEVGEGTHPLLTSMGRLAADYLGLLQNLPYPYTQASTEFPDIAETTLLSALQRDILQATRRDSTRLLPAAFTRDGSITLDSCHSRLREVEVLRDRLLGWFNEDPSLRPEDVVVLSPDIEAYSPLITAVFSARAGDGAKIPFRIADRSEGAVNAAARALLLGVHLLGGRLKVSEVLDFLQSEPVAARFQLSMLDLERIGDWVGKAGIRFGADAAHLRTLGLAEASGSDGKSALGLHTWRTGLERLLLGYALEDDGQSLYAGLVPVDDVPAGEADLLGRFAEFVTNLLDVHARASGSGLTAAEWQTFLIDFVRAFLAEGEGDWDVDAALTTAVDACQGAVATLPDEVFALDAVEHLLTRALAEKQGHSDFLSYGVTFCALLPLRTIPFRRVCVLGLDQASFPRRDQPHELDLMSERPRPGDRSLRAEDRQLFLEWIMGARERLALSYVGRSIQDDSECPVSVVVTELADVLNDMVEPEARPALVAVQHPLQPFSPRYFTPDSPLQSFDTVSYAGAQALTSVVRAEVSRRPAFYVGPLPRPVRSGGSADSVSVELEELVRFWKDPAKGFLSRLRVTIDDEIDQFEDREPVGLDGLERYQLGDELLQRMQHGLPVVREVELGRGQLPLGAAGELTLSTVAAAATRIGIEAERYAPGAEPRWVDVRLDLDVDEEAPSPERASGRVRLVGRLEARGTSLLDVGFRRASARAKLGLWIRHLALSAVGEVERAVLVARPPAGGYRKAQGEEPVTITFGTVPAERARELLSGLVRGYLAGQVTPQCFSPEAALTLTTQASRLLRGTRSSPGLEPEAARALAWAQAVKVLGERDSGLFFEVFRDEDVRFGLSAARAREFERHSYEIFAPMLASLVEDAA